MSEIWKPQSIEVYRGWTDAILSEASEQLTDWEAKFVSDMDDRLSMLASLTQAQAEKLETIYAKYTK